jgi:hypothetical protein
MFNLFADTQRQMQDLLQETRSYVGLQKKVLIVETRDKLAVILSRLAIAVVCLVLGGMALLFFSFFLAYILGQVLDNTALGFACVTLFVLLLLLVFWHWRAKWVIAPITNMLFSLFTIDEEQLDREEVSQQLNSSRTRMSEGFSQLLNTGEKPANRAESVSNWVSRGFAAYEGLRIGLSIMRTLGSIFGRKRRR